MIANTTELDFIANHYQEVRTSSEAICSPLEIEDFGIQTMVDVSPPKWHLAHVSWFFETFILKPYLNSYIEYDVKFAELFNSYYETAGYAHPRPERGLLSRPTVKQVLAYRRHVDEAMHKLLDQPAHKNRSEILRRTLLGCHHEQQHQELLLSDIKHIFSYNPILPVYHQLKIPNGSHVSLNWQEISGNLADIGHCGDGFCYDNELPQHKQYVADFKLANRLSTNGEYLQFIQDGGYSQVDLWLSDGWKTVVQNNWQAPLYWRLIDNQWYEFGLHGLQALDLEQPVVHVSYYEADAFARWSEKRLATEFEWEWASRQNQGKGNFQDHKNFHPVSALETAGLQQMFGDVWEWTQSAYLPYIGFKSLPGTLGEYNGKFMVNQMVLRGGSCATPENHIRATYRNFFYAKDRWQFSGIRLAYTS